VLKLEPLVLVGEIVGLDVSEEIAGLLIVTGLVELDRLGQLVIG